MQDRIDRITRVVIGEDKAKKLTPSSVLCSSGFDSLHKVELAVMLETEFEIHISDDDAEHLHTYSDVLELVKQKTDILAN